MLSRTAAVGSIVGTIESFFPAIRASANHGFQGDALVIRVLDDKTMTLR
ncbi:hypothetical protein [Bradyrhizobium sp. ORS 86]